MRNIAQSKNNYFLIGEPVVTRTTSQKLRVRGFQFLTDVFAFYGKMRTSVVLDGSVLLSGNVYSS
jgi:hypothetical protein